MRTFWESIEYRAGVWKRFIEAIEQQKDRIASVIRTKFQTQDERLVQNILSVLIELENQLTNEDDKRKSATLNKFLKEFQPTPGESAAHTLDRIRRDLADRVTKANLKSQGGDRKAAIRQELRTRLPEEPNEVIENLGQQVDKGARIQDVVNAYLANKRSVGAEDKVIFKEGPYEVIEVSTWREEDGLTDKHIDKPNAQAACHPLFKGTKWCVRFQNYFNDYTSSGSLYMVRMNGKPLVLGHSESWWLDVNDNPPDPRMMAPVAKIIMDMGNPDLAVRAVYYLPNAVDTFESQYAAKYKAQIKEFRHALLGVQYQGVVGGDVFINSFSSLESALEGVAEKSQGKVFQMSDDIDMYIDQASDDGHRMDTSSLVGELSRENENLLIDLLNNKYDQGEYGEIENWEDMDVTEALEAVGDDEIVSVLRDAASETYRDATHARVMKSIIKDLSDGDPNGFTVEQNPDGSFVLSIPSRNANQYISRSLATAHSGEYDQDELILPLWSTMEIEVSEPNYDPVWNQKGYNERAKEQLVEMAGKVMPDVG